MTRDRPPSKLRALTEEEIDLWLSVATTVVRRPGATLPAMLAAPVALKPEAAATKPEAKTKSEVKTKSTPALPPYVPKREAAPASTALDRRVRQKLARGQLRADAAIDLHGLRQAEAHSALRHFLHRAQDEGARIVLVVTGKGGRHGDPFDMKGGGVGVLKRSVPHWLIQSDLRAIVIGFEEAARPHGGAGALYVRLRRRDR